MFVKHFLDFKFLAVLLVFGSNCLALRKLHSWTYLNYTFESRGQYQKAVKDGSYDYTKNIIFDGDLIGDRTFVAIGREQGVPVTLATVDKTKKCPVSGGNLLKPYPDWKSHDMSTCKSMINVYRFAKDSYDRLFVLDNGYNKITYYCPPKILIFDLKSNKLIKTIPIPKEVFPENDFSQGIVTHIVIYPGSSSEHYTLYISESLSGAIIVYSRGSFRRLESNEMKAQPSKFKMTINGTDLTFPFGVVNLALSRSALYFSPLSSTDLSFASLISLQRPAGSQHYTTYRNAAPSQVTSIGFSNKNRALVIAPSTQMSLMCVPVRNGVLQPDQSVTIVDRTSFLDFTLSMKLYEISANSEQVVTIANRFELYLNGKMDFNDENFVIAKGDVTEMMKGTKCDPTYQCSQRSRGKRGF